MPEGGQEGGGVAPRVNGVSARAYDPTLDLPLILGQNLKRLRRRQGYSLDRLSQLSGVSRAMIGQIETAKSVPTISLLSKVAKALDVEFANLLALQETRAPVVFRAERARLLTSDGGQFSSRALFSSEAGSGVEFHEIRLAALHEEAHAAHAPGTRENLIVVKGEVELSLNSGAPVTLGQGDAIEFDADIAHSYRNSGNGEAIAYLVSTRAKQSTT